MSAEEEGIVAEQLGWVAIIGDRCGWGRLRLQWMVGRVPLFDVDRGQRIVKGLHMVMMGAPSRRCAHGRALSRRQKVLDFRCSGPNMVSVVNRVRRNEEKETYVFVDPMALELMPLLPYASRSGSYS